MIQGTISIQQLGHQIHQQNLSQMLITDTVPSGSSDQAPITTPSWVDSRDQPFGAVLLRSGLNVQLRAGYSNDPNMLTGSY